MMKLVYALIGFLGVFALSACATDTATANSGPVSIALTRTICFGFCPAYTVTITGDGQVTYVGRSFVNEVGERRASVPPEAVHRLLSRFDAAHFESLNDQYISNVSDLPTYTIVLERNGVRKSVVDYAGTSVGMPAIVRELEDEIDRVAGTSRWVLRDGQPVRTPQEH